MRGITGGRGILGGAVLLAVGLGVLMQAMGVADAGAYLFLFLGLAFALAYVAARPTSPSAPTATTATIATSRTPKMRYSTRSRYRRAGDQHRPSA